MSEVPLQGVVCPLRQKLSVHDPEKRHCRRMLQVYLAHKKHPPPYDYNRSLGTGLLYGPTGGMGSSERGTSVMCPPAILHSIGATRGQAAAIEGGASTRACRPKK